MKTTEFRQSVYDSALRTLQSQFKKLSELLGEKATLTSYVPRHSWASEALKLHIPMHVISESMGHSNEKTTSIYLTRWTTATLMLQQEKYLKRQIEEVK